jgi:N-acetylneuraminic acid mutarotase
VVRSNFKKTKTHIKKQRTRTIITAFRWGSFFVVLLILVIQVMPRAFGQRVISKSTSSVKAPSHPNGGSWAVTDSLSTARYLHTATLLPNGMALVAGGLDSNFNASASAELYDPASGTWTATGSLNSARTNHTATQLPNGKVLVAGGLSNGALPSSELYDPTTGTWTVTGSLNTARESHTAALLSNGMVLVAGGYDSNTQVLASAELYDPVSGSWTFTGNLNTARTVKNATLLTNGMVLVAAGSTNSGILRAQSCMIRSAGAGLSPAA